MKPLIRLQFSGLGWAVLLGILAVGLFACRPGGNQPGQRLLEYTDGVVCQRPCEATAGDFEQRIRPNSSVPTRALEVQSPPMRTTRWQVFAALTDPAVFTEFSGAPASAHSKPGSLFLNEYGLFGGILTALTLQVDAGAGRIDLYQLWNGSAPLPEGHPQAGTLSMPKNHFTLVKFSISETDRGVVLTVNQQGVPEHSANFVAAGWERFYLKPIKAYLEREGATSARSDR